MLRWRCCRGVVAVVLFQWCCFGDNGVTGNATKSFLRVSAFTLGSCAPLFVVEDIRPACLMVNGFGISG